MMGFNNIIGHDEIIGHLKNAIDAGKISHSIFLPANQVLVRNFLQELLRLHSNVKPAVQNRVRNVIPVRKLWARIIRILLWLHMRNRERSRLMRSGIR